MVFFLFTGYLIISIFIFIIFFGKILSIKDSGKNVYLEMPWNKFLVISIIVGLVISPIWMILGLFVGAMPTDSSGITQFYFYATVICAIATVILNVILLRICIVGINKQREEKNMQPTLWPYALIIIYIFAIPGGFIYVILLEIGVI